MKFIYKAHTDKGAVRKANEDNFGVEIDTVNGSLFVVCDGMGGHVGGAMASSIAVKSILDFFKLEFHENPFIALDNAFQFANTQIFAKTMEDPSLKGMGTTGVILLIRDENIYVGHVGDSRIYIKSRSELSRLTKDHSYVQQLVDQNIIKDEDAESHPQKNQILKALGHSEEVKPTICDKAIKAKRDDLFLLCSDGQCGMVRDKDMEELIEGNNLEASVENLFNVAMENGGTDNITNILIKVTESAHSASSFVNVGPTRSKPRNPDFESTTGITPGPEIDYPIEIKGKSKMTTYAIAASAVLVIAVICFFIFRDDEEKPTKPEDGNEVKTTYTHQELEKKTVSEMDAIITQSENENILCRECDKKKVKIGDFNYSIKINENDVITDITRTEAIVETPKPVKNETDDERKKRLEKEKTDKKIADEKKKAEEEAKKAGNQKTVSYKAKEGDVYSTLSNYGFTKCGKKVRMSDWEPKIKNAESVKAGKTYTCTCPK
jgi:serine/threonine protein phosphatase PrpC